MITKTDFGAKLLRLNRIVTQNKTKHLLVENELKQLKTFDSSYFNDRSYFEEDGTPNYLVFPPLNKYFKADTSTDRVLSWKSTGLSAESIKPLTTSNNEFNPILDYSGTKTRVWFDGCCLKQDKVTFNHGKIGNIYIVYKIIRIANINGNRNSNLTVQNALFAAVIFTKNAYVNKYKYSRYEIGFDNTSIFSFPGGRNDQNLIIFGVVDMNSSVHVDNKAKDILILEKGLKQGLVIRLILARVM